uniref:Uncharacterized protein n=1 Tax=Tetranychus urticae TaxID=32264 RepID=T1JWZ9_TETUR
MADHQLDCKQIPGLSILISELVIKRRFNMCKYFD